MSSVLEFCILQLLRDGMQGVILSGTEILLAACPGTPAPHCSKKTSQLYVDVACTLWA